MALHSVSGKSLPSIFISNTLTSTFFFIEYNTDPSLALGLKHTHETAYEENGFCDRNFRATSITHHYYMRRISHFSDIVS